MANGQKKDRARKRRLKKELREKREQECREVEDFLRQKALEDVPPAPPFEEVWERIKDRMWRTDSDVDTIE